jgi:hypothetical protein
VIARLSRDTPEPGHVIPSPFAKLRVNSARDLLIRGSNRRRRSLAEFIQSIANGLGMTGLVLQSASLPLANGI